MDTKNLPKSVPQAYVVLGIEETAKPDVSGIPERFRTAVLKHYDAMIVAEALNGPEYEPDFTNSNERKCLPWFIVNANKKNKSGFGLSYYYYVFTNTNTVVGARLVLKNPELATYMGETFREELFEPYMLRNTGVK